ncbi:MAG: hypothetical protein OER88_06920, partial [Planctomycetota bacterium]|nr:hypothetical protein [Planctomycetota bacterium]
MRLVAALCFLALPLFAQDAAPEAKQAPAAPPIATRLPAGATAYLEVNDVAGKVRAFLDSPLGLEIREHVAVKAFLDSPQGKQLRIGDAFLKGINGKGMLGLLDTIASSEIAVAVYGQPQNAVVVARVHPLQTKQLLAAATLFAQGKIQTVTPEDKTGAALYKFGPVYYMVDGDLLMATGVEKLARGVRDRNRRQSVLGQTNLAAARTAVGEKATVFGYVDLATYAKELAKTGKPKDLGQALILGAFAYYVPKAPWAGVGVRIVPAGRDWTLQVDGAVPAPTEPTQAVEEAFGGSLEALPFRLPERTLGVVRLRRSLKSVWEHREALIAEAGIPGLIQFESNFGNLTYMSFVEEFLPNVGDE